MKKYTVYILIGLVAVISTLAYLWYTNGKLCCTNDSGSDDNKITVESFEFEKSYLGNSKWSYSIVGMLPTPCYTATVEGLVAESYPEQVSIVLTITKPDADTMCAQVIQDYSYEGEFSASEKAVVTFSVKTAN